MELQGTYNGSRASYRHYVDQALWQNQKQLSSDVGSCRQLRKALSSLRSKYGWLIKPSLVWSGLPSWSQGSLSALVDLSQSVSFEIFWWLTFCCQFVPWELFECYGRKQSAPDEASSVTCQSSKLVFTWLRWAWIWILNLLWKMQHNSTLYESWTMRIQRFHPELNLKRWIGFHLLWARGHTIWIRTYSQSSFLSEKTKILACNRVEQPILFLCKGWTKVIFCARFGPTQKFYFAH